MRAQETVSHLASFERRGPGTDAERRAARWLAEELAAAGREVRIEPFWCRPNWALAHAWHAALAIAGSLVSVAAPRVGGALLLAALVFVVADELTGISPGRRLTAERASQNVVALPRTRSGHEGAQVHLVLTANYDAGRTGLVYRDAVRRAFARARQALAGRGPGWLGWLSIAIAWLLVTAVMRVRGSNSATVGVAQLPPTAALVIGLALLLDIGASGCGPAAGDNGSGAAVALALARALDTAPPSRVAVEVVLQGAGEGGGIGLRRYLRARRRRLRAANAVVVGLAPAAAGRPRWWVSDGAFVALPYFRRLRQICAATAEQEPAISAAAHRGRGATPALRARAARIPAIAIGCLDERGLVPRSHQPSDTAAAVDPAALDAALQFGVLLVDAIDAFLAQAWPPQSAATASVAPG